MKLPGGPFAYRHPPACASVEFVAGLWCVVVGILLVSDGYGSGVLPTVVAALPFWVAYHLLHPLARGRRSPSPAGPLTERELGLLQLHEPFVVTTTFPSADRP